MKSPCRGFFRSALIVVLVEISFVVIGEASPLAPQHADTLYFGGDIITMKGATPQSVEALAVREGRIIFTGTLSEAKKLLARDSEEVNLQGKTLLPGFIDGHSHLLTHADGYTQAPLSPPPIGKVNSIENIIRELQALRKREKLADGSWLIGSGYDQNFLLERRHPTARDLDQAFPDVPVILIHASGHMLVANSRAFQVVGINSSTPDPEGGTILRRAGSREPEGLVQEMAMAAFSEFASPARESRVDLDLIRRSVDYYASHGITTASEHLVMHQKMSLINAAAEQGLFYIDLVATPVFLLADKLFSDSEFRWRRHYEHGLKYAGIKVAVDGSPQGKTAFLSKPYLTKADGIGTDNRGFPNISQKELDALLSRAYRKGVQV